MVLKNSSIKQDSKWRLHYQEVLCKNSEGFCNSSDYEMKRTETFFIYHEGLSRFKFDQSLRDPG